MGVLLFPCPLAAAIGDVTIPACPEAFGQIQKLVFCRLFSAPGVKNTFSAANILLLASWVAAEAAIDDTKLQVTPFVQGPETVPGEPIEFGGGNETVGGSVTIVGTDPTRFNARFDNIAQNTIKQLKTFAGEKLGVYVIDQHGQIGAIADDPVTPTTYYPIEITQGTYALGDKKFGGLNEPDSNTLRFEMPSNWSDDLVPVTGFDFDPLSQLVNT